MMSLSTDLPSPSLVYIVDDDAGLRASLASLLRSIGLSVECFDSVAAFRAAQLRDEVSCLLLDVRLRGANGLELQDTLAREGRHIPIVFMTGYGDIPMSVRAMKGGAEDFLTKPLREHDLLDAVYRALRRDTLQRQLDSAHQNLRMRYASLTPREREVMQMAVQGLMNKQIADCLGTSEITVKTHRRNAMRKMAARSFADLVRMAQTVASPAIHTSL